jgi:GH15 family glucan-1,4-alpha-glucosidase
MPVAEDASAIQPTREILRVIEGIAGEVELEVRFEPRPNYARVPPRFRSRGTLGWACTWSDELFLLRGDMPLELASDATAVVGCIKTRAGKKRYVSLCYAKADIGVIAPLGEAADERMRATVRWWTGWSSRCAYEGPYRDAVLRSAMTLKLMTFALSGAVVAAPTTSLPEAIAGERNWDYRYCWIRDAALTMRAFTGLGYQGEAGSFLQWLLHATRLTWPELQVMYDVYGRTNLRERELSHLSGFRASRPVRIGNGAHTQVQLDVYGGIATAALDYVQSGGPLQGPEARLLVGCCCSWLVLDTRNPTIRACAGRSTSSMRGSDATVSSTGTNPAVTACRRGKAHSGSAASGRSITLLGAATAKTRSGRSIAFLRSPTTSGCSRRRSTRRRATRWGTSRRRSHTSA